MDRYTHWAEEHLGLHYRPVDIRPAKRQILKGLAISFVSILVIGIILSTIFTRRAVTHVQVTMISRADILTSPFALEPTKRALKSKNDFEKKPASVPGVSQAKKPNVEVAKKPNLPQEVAAVSRAKITPTPSIQATVNASQLSPLSPAALPERPSNIATAEKFGIRQIASNMIILLNGSRVAVNGRFPNGELLLSIDQLKGIVETDRRTMVIATP